MRAGSGCGVFARRVAAAAIMAALATGPAAAAVPEGEHPLQLAQSTDGSAEQPPVSSTPDSFTATYGDWQLRCFRNVADPSATALACEAVTFVTAQGQQQPFAQISISRGGDEAMHLTAIVPINILVRSQPMVSIAEGEAGIPVPWLTCTPLGCAADVGMTDEDLQRYRAFTGQGRLVFTDSVGNEVTVLFSFRGLAQALDALNAELAK
jgi:invasion protein IalB